MTDKKPTDAEIVKALELNKIYNIDCIEGMKHIPNESIDMILCDLPYGQTKMKWDKPLPFEPLWEQYKRIIKPDGAIVLFCNGLFTIDLINSNRKMFKYKLIWKKNVPTGMSSAKYRPMKYYEEICVFAKGKTKYNPIMKKRVGKGKACYNYEHYCNPNSHINLKKQKKKYNPDFVQPSDILEINVVPNRKGKLHPTQKPVELLEYLVKTYTNKGDIVLDNCMGSGSTKIACINTNREYIGFEISKEYCEIANERVKVIEE